MKKIRTIIVDDEELQRLAVQEICLDSEDIQVTGMFKNAKEAEAFARKNKVDLALLDIAMPGASGIELGRRLSGIWPDILLIYLTAYEEYALDAYKVEAVSYLLKPVQEQAFRKCMDRVRKLIPDDSARIQMKMFGTFHVQVDQRSVNFGYQKAKELLALLVDAEGADVTEERVISCLWEHRCYDSRAKALYRKTVMELRKVLVDENIESLCTFEYGRCHVNTEEFECDSYRILQGKGGYEMAYIELGYLNEYSWGELTRGCIEQMLYMKR